MREDPPLEVTVATVVAERQASAGARDGVKGKRSDLAARAPLHALVGWRCYGNRSSVRIPGLDSSHKVSASRHILQKYTSCFV